MQENKPSAFGKDRDQHWAHTVVGMAQRHKAIGWVDYIGFDYYILKKVQELEPYAKLVYPKSEKDLSEFAKDRMFGSD